MKRVLGTVVLAILAFAGWRHAQPAGFPLYQGIAVAVAAAGLFYLKTKAANDALLVFFVVYGFVFTIPTTVDRSYSVRMIEWIAAAPEGVARDQVGAMFRDYFEKGDGAERRIVEQQRTGSITVHDGRVRITGIGRFLAWSFRLTADLFALKRT